MIRWACLASFQKSGFVPRTDETGSGGGGGGSSAFLPPKVTRAAAFRHRHHPGWSGCSASKASAAASNCVSSSSKASSFVLSAMLKAARARSFYEGAALVSGCRGSRWRVVGVMCRGALRPVASAACGIGVFVGARALKKAKHYSHGFCWISGPRGLGFGAERTPLYHSGVLLSLWPSDVFDRQSIARPPKRAA